MNDKTYTFTRGIDTVHVTVGRKEVGRARNRVLLTFGGLALILGMLGVIVWPLLVPAGFLAFYTYGKVLMLENLTREQAEAQANRQFDRMESERWRAYRALGTD